MQRRETHVNVAPAHIVRFLRARRLIEQIHCSAAIVELDAVQRLTGVAPEERFCTEQGLGARIGKHDPAGRVDSKRRVGQAHAGVDDQSAEVTKTPERGAHKLDLRLHLVDHEARRRGRRHGAREQDRLLCEPRQLVFEKALRGLEPAPAPYRVGKRERNDRGRRSEPEAREAQCGEARGGQREHERGGRQERAARGEPEESAEREQHDEGLQRCFPRLADVLDEHALAQPVEDVGGDFDPRHRAAFSRAGRWVGVAEPLRGRPHQDELAAQRLRREFPAQDVGVRHLRVVSGRSGVGNEDTVVAHPNIPLRTPGRAARARKRRRHGKAGCGQQREREMRPARFPQSFAQKDAARDAIPVELDVHVAERRGVAECGGRAILSKPAVGGEFEQHRQHGSRRDSDRAGKRGVTPCMLLIRLGEDQVEPYGACTGLRQPFDERRVHRAAPRPASYLA